MVVAILGQDSQALLPGFSNFFCYGDVFSFSLLGAICIFMLVCFKHFDYDEW